MSGGEEKHSRLARRRKVLVDSAGIFLQRGSLRCAIIHADSLLCVLLGHVEQETELSIALGQRRGCYDARLSVLVYLCKYFACCPVCSVCNIESLTGRA